MRLQLHLSALAIALYCALPALGADEKAGGPLAEARTRWLKGNYAEARDLYRKLLKEPKLQAAAAIGLARTFVSEGDLGQAIAAIDDALKNAESNPDLLAAKAELLYQSGKWEQAFELAQTVIKAKEDHFLARWVRAQILRDRGDMKEADQEMRWFVRAYTRRSNMDADIKDPDELLIVGQAGSENARWHSLSDQFEFILNEIYTDVTKIEPECWMAEYFAGAMLLEKVNLPEAVKAFDKALKLNPRATDAFVGKGQAALAVFEMKDAELFADQALKINPKHSAALRLRADIHLMTGESDQALSLLERARAVNDHDESTQARLALWHYQARQTAAFEKVIADVKKFNPKPGLFFHQLALALEERKHFLDAEKYFRAALEANDKLAAPKNELGLLYLRLGKEDEAKEQLDKAFAFDPFNVRVANSRKVLKHLAGYQTKESTHYIVRFDPKTDKLLAEFVLEFLEEIHSQLSKDFAFEPKGKTLVEVFNNHEMFSGRTVALPDLHTIGACTGCVVTMVSPRGKGLAKTFNWARVIRHELVHIFNLAQTDFQVPHWLTEGLAVRNEGGARPPSWDAFLRERYDKNDLFNLDNILLGFVRPRSPDEWSLAYCQSLLYVEYLIKNHGIAAVGKMLNAFQAGLDTGVAIKKVCGIDKAEFEKGYRDYLASVVKSIPPPRAKEKSMTSKEIEEAHEKDPENADLSARLATEYWRRKRTAEAGKLADQVLAKHNAHPAATIVKARLLIADGDEIAARKLVEAAVDRNREDVRLRGYLAKLCLDSKEFTAAAEQFEQCQRLDPISGEWLVQLQDLYAKLDERSKLVDVLKRIALRDADDLAVRKRIAKLLIEAKEFAEAEVAAREALQIDVLDPEAQRLIVLALREQKKDAEADRLAKRFANE